MSSIFFIYVKYIFKINLKIISKRGGGMTVSPFRWPGTSNKEVLNG